MQQINTLPGRKHDILMGAIEDYINDASPITSGGVKEKRTIDYSTATLRSELNALEAMGYLKQLHTSGGRVPTVMGYRYYVNQLLGDVKIDKHALDCVHELLNQRTKSLTEIVSELAKIISKIVHYPTVVYANGYDKLVIESIKVIPLIDGHALALIQTSSGYLTNTIAVSADYNSCENASEYLTKIFAGKTISHLMSNFDKLENNMQSEIATFGSIINSLISGLKAVIENNKFDICHQGSAQLLAENTDRSEQTKTVLRLLDNESELQKTLESGENNDLSITLVGQKSSGFALVKAPLCINGKSVASIGVLGPQRMNYASIASALKVVMAELTNFNKKENL